jgi:hypothetical protein
VAGLIPLDFGPAADYTAGFLRPRRPLPVAAGTLAVVVGVLWYTSALWYYNGFQLRAP